MGYQTAAQNRSISLSETPNKIWLSAVECSGGEGSLAACKHSDWGVSSCETYAGVLCAGMLTSNLIIHIYKNSYGNNYKWCMLIVAMSISGLDYSYTYQCRCKKYFICEAGWR